ncbi:MAG: SUMF1/EgtB/PvdO family nonheme iron enzyme, partial [Anaerolineae bacterium]|nr:SUMF1/EgtB/PvdO family nonheme iron enzyme [Anaerolineae bacterium]
MDIEHLWRENDAEKIFDIARQLEADGALELAGIAYDRAYGLAPTHEAIQRARATLLDRLAIVEHGMVFRYIPAGIFLMGSDVGDPDEAPVHPVQLDAYWLSETPISWVKYCELMGFRPPPDGDPDEDWEKRQSQAWVQQVMNLLPIDVRDPDIWVSALSPYQQLCVQYCENETIQATDWHAHIPSKEWRRGTDGMKQTSADIIGMQP